MTSTGAPTDADKIDLAPWGYAPGDRLVTCSDCTREHPLDDLHFLHFHATRCAKHALAARQAALAAAIGPGPVIDRSDHVDALRGLSAAYNDRLIRTMFIASILLSGLVVGLIIGIF